MSLTLLAGLLTPLYLKMVLDPKGTQKGMKEVLKSPGLAMTFSMFYFILGVLILASTGLGNFQLEWDSLLAWLGLLIFVKGIFVLLAPSVMDKWANKFKANNFPLFGFIGLLMALFLVYVDLKILA